MSLSSSLEELDFLALPAFLPPVQERQQQQSTLSGLTFALGTHVFPRDALVVDVAVRLSLAVFKLRIGLIERLAAARVK